ncbi:MAG: class I SAM-dependent methyltransferase [Candidatus Aminicenantes bacterium]|nr:class I SAM-dependent methyltransferase [Candidatus Aminicenantes bacterium]
MIRSRNWSLKLSELSVYFARAMDEITGKEIVQGDKKYTKLLSPLNINIINPYQEEIEDPVKDGLSIAQRDLELLSESDIVLADLSIPGYQYIGCIFEIVHAYNKDIPVIVVEGERNFHKRLFMQAYCDFICRTADEAREYIYRAYTLEGIEKQMAEMHAYYEKIAWKYTDNSAKTYNNRAGYKEERDVLRAQIRKYVRGKTFQAGIGIGDLTKTVCENSVQVVGIEQSREMINQAYNNLSSYDNINILHGDIFKDNINGGPFDSLVAYFFLSLLPRSMQKRFFQIVHKILKPGGLLIAADTKAIGDLAAVGLGRRLLQKRKNEGQEFVLYKEHFVGDSLAKLLENNGLSVVESSDKTTWFSWAIARNS